MLEFIIKTINIKNFYNEPTDYSQTDLKYIFLFFIHTKLSNDKENIVEQETPEELAQQLQFNSIYDPLNQLNSKMLDFNAIFISSDDIYVTFKITGDKTLLKYITKNKYNKYNINYDPKMLKMIGLTQPNEQRENMLFPVFISSEYFTNIEHQLISSSSKNITFVPIEYPSSMKLEDFLLSENFTKIFIEKLQFENKNKKKNIYTHILLNLYQNYRLYYYKKKPRDSPDDDDDKDKEKDPLEDDKLDKAHNLYGHILNMEIDFDIINKKDITSDEYFNFARNVNKYYCSLLEHYYRFQLPIVFFYFSKESFSNKIISNMKTKINIFLTEILESTQPLIIYRDDYFIEQEKIQQQQKEEEKQQNEIDFNIALKQKDFELEKEERKKKEEEKIESEQKGGGLFDELGLARLLLPPDARAEQDTDPAADEGEQETDPGAGEGEQDTDPGANTRADPREDDADGPARKSPIKIKYYPYNRNDDEDDNPINIKNFLDIFKNYYTKWNQQQDNNEDIFKRNKLTITIDPNSIEDLPIDYLKICIIFIAKLNRLPSLTIYFIVNESKYKDQSKSDKIDINKFIKTLIYSNPYEKTSFTDLLTNDVINILFNNKNSNILPELQDIDKIKEYVSLFYKSFKYIKRESNILQFTEETMNDKYDNLIHPSDKNNKFKLDYIRHSSDTPTFFNLESPSSIENIVSMNISPSFLIKPNNIINFLYPFSYDILDHIFRLNKSSETYDSFVANRLYNFILDEIYRGDPKRNDKDFYSFNTVIAKSIFTDDANIIIKKKADSDTTPFNKDDSKFQPFLYYFYKILKEIENENGFRNLLFSAKFNYYRKLEYQVDATIAPMKVEGENKEEDDDLIVEAPARDDAADDDTSDNEFTDDEDEGIQADKGGGAPTYNYNDSSFKVYAENWKKKHIKSLEAIKRVFENRANANTEGDRRRVERAVTTMEGMFEDALPRRRARREAEVELRRQREVEAKAKAEAKANAETKAKAVADLKNRALPLVKRAQDKLNELHSLKQSLINSVPKTLTQPENMNDIYNLYNDKYNELYLSMDDSFQTLNMEQDSLNDINSTLVSSATNPRIIEGTLSPIQDIIEKADVIKNKITDISTNIRTVFEQFQRDVEQKKKDQQDAAEAEAAARAEAEAQARADAEAEAQARADAEAEAQGAKTEAAAINVQRRRRAKLAQRRKKKEEEAAAKAKTEAEAAKAKQEAEAAAKAKTEAEAATKIGRFERRGQRRRQREREEAMKEIEEKRSAVINEYNDIRSRIINLKPFYPEAISDIKNAKEYQFPQQKILGDVLKRHDKTINTYESYRLKADKKINDLNSEIEKLQKKFNFNKDYDLIKKENNVRRLNGELATLAGTYADTKKNLAYDLSKYYRDYEVKVDETDKKKVDDAIKTINNNEQSGIDKLYDTKLIGIIQDIKKYNELLKSRDKYIDTTIDETEVDESKIISNILKFTLNDDGDFNMRRNILELLKFPKLQKTIILINAENIAKLPTATDVDVKTKKIKMAYDPMAPTRAPSGLPLGPYVSRFQQLDSDGNDIRSSDITKLLNPFSAARDARAPTAATGQRQGLAQLDSRVFPNPLETSPRKAGRRRPAAGRSALTPIVPLYGKSNDEDERVTPEAMKQLAIDIGANTGGGYKPPSSKYQKTKKNRKEKIKHKQTNKKQKKNKKNIILTKTSKIYSKSRKNNKKILKHKTSLHNIR